MKELFSLDDAQVKLIKKCVARILPPVCYDSVFSRQAVDALQRREGIRIEKTALGAKEISPRHCLIFSAKGGVTQLKIRGTTDKGCPAWFTLEWASKDSLRPIAIDPAMLFVDREALALTVSEGESKSSVRTVSIQQGAKRTRVQALSQDDSQRQDEVVPSVRVWSDVDADPKALFESTTYPFFQKISLLSGVSDAASWLTILRTPLELQACWKTGLNTVCTLSDATPSASPGVTLTTPGQLRLLSWIMSLGKLQLLRLDPGSRGGTAETQQDGIKVRIQFLAEANAYESQPVTKELAANYFRIEAEVLETSPEAKIVDVLSLSRNLSLCSAFLYGFGESKIAGVSFGQWGSKPKELAYLAKEKGSRALFFSPEGLPSAAFPIVVLDVLAATALSKILRIYSGFVANKQTTVRLLNHSNMEGIFVGESADFCMFSQTSSDIHKSIKNELKVASTSSSVSEADVLDSIDSIYIATRAQETKCRGSESSAVVGASLGDLVVLGKTEGILVATGSLGVLGQTFSKTFSNPSEMSLVQSEDLYSSVSAMKRVREAITEQMLSLKASFLKYNKTSRGIEFILKGKEKSYCIVRCLRLPTNDPKAALKLNVPSLPKVESYAMASSKSESLETLLRSHCLSHDKAALETNRSMRVLEDALFDPETHKLWMSDKVSVVSIDSDMDSPEKILVQRYVPAVVTSVDKAVIMQDDKVTRIQADRTRVIVNNSGLSGGDYPIKALQQFFAACDVTVPSGALCGSLEAEVSLSALMDSANASGNRLDSMLWIWHKSGSYGFLKTTDLLAENKFHLGSINSWADPLDPELSKNGFMVSCLSAGWVYSSLLPIKTYLESQGKTDMVLKVTLRPTRMKIEGEHFSLLLLSRSNEMYEAKTLSSLVPSWNQRLIA